MPRNKTRPKENNQLISYASLSNQNNILNDNENIIIPINLQRATISYFSFSSGGIVLYPAIKKEPLPLINKIPNTINSPMTNIITTNFIPPTKKSNISVAYSTIWSVCERLILLKISQICITSITLSFSEIWFLIFHYPVVKLCRDGTFHGLYSNDVDLCFFVTCV